MENSTQKVMLPPPVFKTTTCKLPSPHFASPAGMLMSKDDQPPPMYGPKGSTVPAKYLKKEEPKYSNYNENFSGPFSNSIASKSRFWCENCDFGFAKQLELENHRREFKNCSVNGCNFYGCKKIVAKHIEEQHVTGLYDQIKNLNTPEEIEKWKEERRKRYPTVKNVELRQKAQEARKNRGERIENNKSRFGSKGDRNKINSGLSNELKRKNQGDNSNQRKGNLRRDNHNRFAKNKIVSKTKETLINPLDDEDDYEENSFPKFKGTGTIPDYNRTSIEKPVEKNVLTNLLGMYGESSDSESENNEEDKTNSEKENIENCEIQQDRISDSINENDENLQKDSEISEDTADLHLVKVTSDEEILNVAKNTIDDDHDNEKKNSFDEGESGDEMPNEEPILRKSNQNQPPTQVEFDHKDNNNENLHKKDFSKQNMKRSTDFKPSYIRSKVRRVGSLLDYSNLRKNQQNTLLEKLLEPQIRHERNVLLQCVRYVVENKFFGVGQEIEADKK